MRPNTILPADQIPTGRYARMAHQHLEENFPRELDQMTQQGTITAFLDKIQTETASLVQDRIRELTQSFQKKNLNPGFLKMTNAYNHAMRTAEEEILPTVIMTVVPPIEN